MLYHMKRISGLKAIEIDIQRWSKVFKEPTPNEDPKPHWKWEKYRVSSLVELACK